MEGSSERYLGWDWGCRNNRCHAPDADSKETPWAYPEEPKETFHTPGWESGLMRHLIGHLSLCIYINICHRGLKTIIIKSDHLKCLKRHQVGEGWQVNSVYTQQGERGHFPKEAADWEQGSPVPAKHRGHSIRSPYQKLLGQRSWVARKWAHQPQLYAEAGHQGPNRQDPEGEKWVCK